MKNSVSGPPGPKEIRCMACFGWPYYNDGCQVCGIIVCPHCEASRVGCSCDLDWRKIYAKYRRSDDDDSPTSPGVAKLGLPNAPTTLEINTSVNDYLAASRVDLHAVLGHGVR